MGHWVALCHLGPKNLKIKCQAFPHDGSTGLKWPTLASLPVTDNYRGLDPRVQLDVVGRSNNFLVDTGAAYPVLTSYSGAFSQTYTNWVLQEKQLLKDSPKYFFVTWMDKYFSTSFSGAS